MDEVAEEIALVSPAKPNQGIETFNTKKLRRKLDDSQQQRRKRHVFTR
jgi:hypothetical protein